MEGSSWWEFLDHLSTEPKLYIKSKDRYVTKFGALMTVLSAVAMLTLSAYFFYIFLEKRELGVVFFTETRDINPYMDLNGKPFFFKFVDGNQRPIDEKLAKVWPTYWILEKGKRKVIHLETESCTFEKHLKEEIYKEMFAFNISDYQCFKPNKYNLNLSLDALAQSNTYFNIYVAECKNLTENNNHCYPPEKIEDELKNSNLYFEYYFPNDIIDHYNKTAPLKMFNNHWLYKLYYGFFHSTYYWVKTLEYYSDDGSVLEDINFYIGHVKDEVNSMNMLSPQTKVYIDKAFANFQFIINPNSVDKYRRYYTKLQAVIANIGGVLKFINVAALIIAKFVTSKMMFVDLSNSIIHYPATDAEKDNLPQDFIHNITYSKLQINHQTIKLHNKERKSLLPAKVKKLSFKETFLPKKCLPQSSAVNIVGQCEHIIRKKLSCDNFMNVICDIDKLKLLLLDEKQRIVFQNVKNPTLEAYLKQFSVENITTLPTQLEELLNDLAKNHDGMSKSLLKRFDE